MFGSGETQTFATPYSAKRYHALKYAEDYEEEDVAGGVLGGQSADDVE